MPRLLDWGNRHEHASLFRPSTGRHSAIQSKAMVLRRDGRQIVFVSLDLVGVEKRMLRDLARRLTDYGVEEHELVVGATHTHSGPGTLTKRPSLAIVAVDRFRRENYEHVIDRIALSVKRAFAGLQTVTLHKAQFETEGLQRNKWRRKDERHYDRRARFLLVRSSASGMILGGLLNYALHGNGMPVEDLRFSSDTPGSIALQVEDAIAEVNGVVSPDPVVLYFNGAEGDVGNRERSVDAVRDDGWTFRQQAVAARVFEKLQAVDGRISISRRKVWLGLPGVSFRNCIDKWNAGKKKRGYDLRLPLPLMQQRTFVSLISIGDVHMLTWPGEPSVQVGYDTQDLAADAGYADSWLLGLTNDYQSYFTTQEEYYEGVYDSCSSLFRWKGTRRIQAALVRLLTEGQ